MLYGLYQFFGWLTFILGAPVLLLYIVCTGRYREGLGQRLGFLADGWKSGEQRVRIWLHGASVGEIQLAKLLIKEIGAMMPEADFVLSTVTEQGMEVARKMPDPRVRCIYAPLDLAGIVGRALRRIKPVVYICLETELWPAFLLQAKSSGCKLVILNGRLSDRSYRRYQLAKGLMAKILDCFSMIAVIQRSDAKRFVSLGAEPQKVRILGNAKYDQDRESLAPEKPGKYRDWLNLHPDQPLLVAGSTHTGEEEMLLQVFLDLKKATGMQNLVLVVAPRHMQRLPEVEAMFKRQEVSYELLSNLKSCDRREDTVLVDTIGDLTGIYSIASYVFCGGSLVERGGHNIMEPALFGRPVFYGPSMKDFSDAAELLESAGGGFQIKDTASMTEAILYFMDHPAEYEIAGKRAQEIAAAQQGAARKQAELVKEVLGH